MYEHVTRSEQAHVRRLAHNTFTKLRNILRNEYKFYTGLVGSGKKGTIIRDEENRFDIDYQIILTKNSKIFKEKGDFDPTQTKQRFFGSMRKILEPKSLEDSTTAITLNDPKDDFSIDFVIIDGTDADNWKIIRRNNKDSKNEYTWNKLPSVKEYSAYYGSLEESERSDLKNKIINLKIKDKKLPDHKRKDSYIVTMQAIKEHKDKHGHKR